jgi:hypothetical protein
MSAHWLVVDGGGEFEVAEEFAVERDNAEVASGDEEDDAPAGVGVAEAEAAAVADRDVAGLGHLVVADR